MATESPIRIPQGTDQWTTLKPLNSYRPSSAEMAIQRLGLFLKENELRSHENDVVPTRSESAPPSMEGSMAAMEDMFSKKVPVSSLRDNSDSKLDKKLKRAMHGAKYVDGPITSLPSHKEESEDDQLSEQSVSASVEKGALWGYRSNSLDSSQVLSLDGSKDSFVEPPSHERDLDTSTSRSDTHIYQKSEPLTPLSTIRQAHMVPQDSSSQRVEGSHPYGTLTHPFHYVPSSASGQEIQHMLQSPGFKPPLFTAYSQYYPSMQQQGYVHPQHGTPYSFNSSVFPPYIGGYSQHGSVPMVFNGASFPLSGVDISGLYAYDPHNLMKFYGQFSMQYVQPSSSVQSMYGPFDQTPRGGSSLTQVSPWELRKGGEHKPQNLSGNGYNKLNPPRGANYSGGRYYGGVSHSSSARPSGSSVFQSPRWNDVNSYSVLEELKSGKGQRYKLSDVAGHICEFSIDQHGSRFIQQQLETCSDEEKTHVFDEVVPHASKLITDVFGNYVIQKLFEYGSSKQRENLATLLQGQILPLSLQMYGCRVIQKALDVIELEKKAKLVRELDGHVIRCVRDQNGNHVIQKCIESIPSEEIEFIISSFRGQVASLSMHPYGCRVIQRVLERCEDGSHTQFIIDEILESVCTLAQDQYGNYVTQHVLERGNPRERSVIIEKLTECVVQLSQHKFASNVVEKCMEYSDAAARDSLIKEIIGRGEKNDNLLMMMKDQYANYVIQKILQKCSDDEHDVLIGLVRSHLTSLKKYTYGKHIVARFEMLCGEEFQETGQ